MSSPGDRDPTRPDERVELELADVPRGLSRRPSRGPAREGTLAPPAGDPAAAQAHDAATGPRAGTMAPEPGAASPSVGAAARPSAARVPSPMGGTALAAPNPWLGRGLAAAVAVAALFGGLWLYRRLTRPDIIEITSPYRSSTGITLDLPGGSGWKSDRRVRIKKDLGGGWLRADVMYRGASSVAAAGELAFAFRVHAPGRFAYIPDIDQLLKNLEAGLRQAAVAGGADTQSLTCATDRELRADAALACFGRFKQLGQDLPVGVYVWIAGDDDAVGIAYARLEGSLTPLREMVRTAR